MKANHLIIQTNILNYRQQWYQRPFHLARHGSRLISCSTDWLQLKWRVSRKQTNYQSSSVSFKLENKSQNNRSFGDHLLPIVDLFPHYLMYQQCDNNNYGSSQITFYFSWIRNFVRGSPIELKSKMFKWFPHWDLFAPWFNIILRHAQLLNQIFSVKGLTLDEKGWIVISPSFSSLVFRKVRAFSQKQIWVLIIV